MDHTRPELKYVSARELNGTAARLDGVPVVGSDGETLGKVEGFIIDVKADTPRHVVVAAGWLIHKHFLLPIGHAILTQDDATLRAGITKAQVNGFPGFDKGEFEVEVSRRYPLAAAAEAQRESETGHVRGKIVLIP